MATETSSKSANSSAEGRAKIFEIAFLYTIPPYLLHDLTSLPKPVAFAVGLFVGSLVTYWVPPRFRFGFIKWIGISAAAGILIYFYTRLFG